MPLSKLLSLKNCRANGNRKTSNVLRYSNRRKARLEKLESRQLLAATPVEADSLLELPFDQAGMTIYESAVNAQSDLVVVGAYSGTVDFDLGPGAFELTSSSTPDLFVAKYDATGSLVTATDLGDINIDWDGTPQLTVDSVGDVYISAPYNGSPVLMNGQTLPAPQIQRPNTLFAKIGGDLQTMQWATHATPGPGASYSGSFNVRDLAVDSSGDSLYGVGDMSGTGAFGDIEVTSDWDGIALQISATTGSFQWANTTLGAGFIMGVTVDPTDPTAIYMHGWDGTLNGAFARVLRADSSGTLAWKRLLPETTSAPDSWTDIGAQGGDVYLTGSFSDQATLDQTTLTSAGARDAIAVRFEGASGDVVWARRAGGDDDDVATQIEIDATGNVYLAGSFDDAGDFGGDTLVASTRSDVFVSQLDAIDGTFIQSWRYGRANIDHVATSLGNAYVIGSFDTSSIDFPTGDVPATPTGTANYVMRFASATDPTVPRINGFSAAPNPAEQGDPIILAAAGMHDPDSRVESVAFYHDVDGDRRINQAVDTMLGVDPLGSDGWAFDASTISLPLGDISFLAQATYDGGALSLATSAATRLRLPSMTYASTDVGQKIRDLSTVLSELPVSDSFGIGDVDVNLSIEHRHNSDLDVYLIHPDGTRIELFTDIGGAGRDNENVTDTTLDDQAVDPIGYGGAPFTGRFRPEGQLSDLNGKNSAGSWQLEVSDDDRKDTGTLISWSITLAPDAPIAPTLSVEDISVTEGDAGLTSATFAILRSGDSTQPVSVDFATVDGTATAGSDYASTSGTVHFAPGEVSKTINVDVFGDELEESDETFFFDLSNASGATIAASQAIATITDDDTVSALVDVYIADIRFDSKRGGKDWRAVVEVLTVNGDLPVAGVTLNVDFNGATYTVTTDSNGVARTSWERNLSRGDYLVDAYDVALGDPDYSWTAFAFDLENDSDGDGKPDDLLTV